MTRTALCLLGLGLLLLCLGSKTFSAPKAPTNAELPELNLLDFGAVGDGVHNDGPAFQAALDALAAAGGGTLFVPAGKYAITTPVTKNFAGLASSITLKGVESLTPVIPFGTGNELAAGLDLLTEVYPRTGVSANAFRISGLKSLVVKDLAFVGTADVNTDAANTIYLSDIEKAQIKHCEFSCLATIVGGSIVNAERSDLEITQSKFLGSVANSGVYAPVVQNVEWYGITVTDTVFLDYSLRDLYGKTGFAAPISWVNIGNAAAVTNISPRREVVIRDIFLDEGGYWGLSSLPYRYTPASAPIDLIYITGLQMNVSNFGPSGHLLYDARRVFIENSRYGWSHNASSAIALANVGEAIFDKITCEAHADHIAADALTRELTVINSTYTALDSQAQTTNAIITSPEDDPVQYVRSRFETVLGHAPDPAAHYYWSDLLVHCFEDAACVASNKAALNDYLAKQPAPKFGISGHIADTANNSVGGVKVTMTGSQSVSTTTDANGNFAFANLPTSGRYVITPAKNNFGFESTTKTFIAPAGDQTANFTADHANTVSGVIKAGATPVAGVTVAVSGSTTASAVTDGNGAYSLALVTGGNYVLTPSKAHYTFDPVTKSITDLQAVTQLDFGATVEKFSVSGHVVNAKGEPFAGVTMLLTGSTTAATTTAADGSYSFANIAGGCNCTVSAGGNYLLTPGSKTFGDLSANAVADFQAILLPALLTAAGSDRAIALELTTFIADPFPITSTFLSGGRNRTRVVFFATDLGLLPGEGIEAITAEAEDEAHVKYPLQVEFVNPLVELPQVSQLVIRLTADLENADDVYVTITVHGLTSNKARILVETLGDPD
jgi:hypothetical protein